LRSSAALVLTAALSCSTAVVEEPGPALGERFQLRAGRSARIAGTPVEIPFERVLSDSRCAVDVVCIQAGEARVAFRLEERGRPTESFELDTDRARVAAVDGYQVELFAVLPQPRSTVRTDPRDYAVEISVSR
jgi:hypothetical protein